MFAGDHSKREVRWQWKERNRIGRSRLKTRVTVTFL